LDLSSLKKKYGPLPAWAWALIVSAILYFLYRHFKSTGGSSAQPAATDTQTNTGNVASIPSVDSSGFSGPVDTSGNSVDTLPNTDVAESSATPWWMDPTATGQDTKTVDTTASPVPPLSSPPITNSPPAATPKPAAKPIATAPLKSIIPGIKGKIISQKVLPSGAKLVTLAGGREIEQAKGKKAYVVRK
jgi:hypothetical protein